MHRVLVSENIAEEGISLLSEQSEVQVDVCAGLTPEQLKEVLPKYDALITRSATKVTRELIGSATRLQVIGRAGVGLDNIDVEAATARGIAVVNAPSGNTVAAAEHTIALMLALARNIPRAHQSMSHGRWERSAFVGVEVRRKALGIVGLGRVGAEVAKRAQSFGMQLLGHDPFISTDYATQIGVELVSLEKLLAESDFVTLHSPLTENTLNMMSSTQFAMMKAGARLINVARGGLVDEAALLQALNEGTLAGAALDVFAHEPPGESDLIGHPMVVSTPHLGASTTEAQKEVAIEVAEQVLALLRGEPAENAVNVPFLPPEVNQVVAPYVPVATLVGRLVSQMADGQFHSLDLTYEGEIAGHDTTILRSAVLSGFLSATTSERINVINANVIAQRRGLLVSEQKKDKPQQYSSLLTATVHTNNGEATISGISMRGATHVVRVNQYWLDMVPSVPYLLFVEHQDRPGLIGMVGGITGRHDVNIAFMDVGRLSPRGRAMMVVGLDDPMPKKAMEEITSITYIDVAKVVKL